MFAPDAKLIVFPFTRQDDGGEIVIGRTDTGVFLALPPDAVEILDSLAAGETVGQAQEMYREKYGETPEMEEFLGLLQGKGFVRTRNDAEPAVGATSGLPGTPIGGPQQQSYHFDNIPQPVAGALFGPAGLTAAGVVAALATAATIRAPEIIPSRSSLYFHHDQTLMTLCLMVIGYTTIFLHEMGHLVAARAQGVSSRLGIGRRLWVLVAETDMTGLWSVPRQQRYLPVLAGPLVDVTSAAVILLVLFAHHQRWITLWTPAMELLRALCFVYLLRLLWQCFFFVRTDFYYVIATFFGCKSLMQDTRVYLQNRFRRLVSSPKPQIDQSHLPETERKVIQVYAWIWALGRAIALTVLFLITLPVMVRYLITSSTALLGGFSEGPYIFFDGLFIFLFNLLPIALGLGWWIGSFLKRWRLNDDKRAYAT